MLDSPVADDESTYLFIARTLLNGRIVNPVPEDSSFYANQFITITEVGWFGKYPVGHPLVLSGFELIGMRFLMGPVLAVGTILLTFLIARQLFNDSIAVGSCILLVVSPHFIGTWSTLLSQTTSTVCLLAGVFFTTKLQDSNRWYWALLAGAVLGFGCLVRPLPGVLFLITIALVYLLPGYMNGASVSFAAKMRKVLLAVVPVIVVLAIFMYVNELQTGSFLRTGYHLRHGENAGLGKGIGGYEGWFVALSVMGAMLRQNFWLFGWALSFPLMFFAKSQRSLLWLVSIVLSEYVYRVIAPKTCLATTGPIYVTEIVPFLCVLAVAGAQNLARKLSNSGVANGKKLVASGIAASFVMAGVCFWPVIVLNIHRGAVSWHAAYQFLETEKVSSALVFADRFVPSSQSDSWAYFPPNPSPSLDDDFVFVRIPPGKNRFAQMREFWEKHYRNRPAFIYDPFHPVEPLRRLPYSVQK